MNEEAKTHFRTILESKYLGSWDLAGKEPTVTIDAVKREDVHDTQSGGMKSVMVITFAKAKKPFICNRTNADRITEIAGSPLIENWVGKQITLRVEKVRAFGKTEDAIRVKPKFESKPLRSVGK